MALAWRQFTRNKLAVAGAVLLVLLVLLALLAPVISPYDPAKPNLSHKLVPPRFDHWLGTDHFGRDVLSRALHGSRVSLSVGLAVVILSALVGVPFGLIAGYVGGRVENTIMRVMDALLTFPPLFLAIAIMASLGQDSRNVILALGIVNIPVFARLARGSTLSAKEEVYVTAAQSIGAKSSRILTLHILPNILAAIVVQMTFAFSQAIISEASLSFLGLGIQPPAASWGRDLSEARAYLQDASWLVGVPTSAIIVAVLSLNFLGDGLRDALDPRFRSK